MTLMLGAFLKGEKFEWRSQNLYDLQDDVVIQFFIPANRQFISRDEACDFAAHFVRRLGWCTPSPGIAWGFDLDALRKEFRGALPDWFQGSVSTSANPRSIMLTPPRPGEIPVLDTLEISCRFVHHTPPPDLEQLTENLNRPVEISESLRLFRQDYPDISRVAFIMMKFESTAFHEKIFGAVRSTLARFGMTGVRADGKEYHPNLFENIQTYLHGSRFGIAIVERLTGDEFNPNVSLEIGYLLALRKPVCLLKDRTLRALSTDLTGKLYRSFDPQSPETSIPAELEKWMRDRHLLTPT